MVRNSKPGFSLSAYELTLIGQFAQAIVASEIAQGRFSIKTDKPTNVKVSWQVTEDNPPLA